jgi:hypothetical protein
VPDDPHEEELMPRFANTAPTLAAVASLLVVALGASEAKADLWGIDLAPLTAIASSAAAQVVQLADSLAQLAALYAQAKKVAGYADDAARAYREFQSFGSGVFSGNALSAIESAFPDLAYFRSGASNTGPWAQGTGELQRMIRGCLAGSCFQVRGTVTLTDAKAAVAGTFGEIPPVAGAIEATAMDHEAAVGISSSSAQVGRDAVARAQAKALMEKCTDTGTDDALAACQAAGAAAQILQAEETADLTDAVSESNRLEAARLAQENAKRKREITEAVERRLAILDGLKELVPPPSQVTTDGLPAALEGAH